MTRTPGETAGIYVITSSGAALQGNYSVTYVQGMFKINAAPPAVQYNSPDVPASQEPAKDETVKNETVSEAAPETETISEDIIKKDTPEAAPAGSAWALITLILIIAAVIISILLVVLYFAKKNKSVTENRSR